MSKLKTILCFDEMLTPKIITFVYWLMLVGVTVAGFVTMAGSLFGGLGLIIGGAIGARIWSELMIVLFKIHENLHKLANGNKE